MAMASEDVPKFHAKKGTRNYQLLCRLLIDIGTHVLREIFEKTRPPGNLDTVLSSPPVHSLLKSLLSRRVLNHYQWEKLYPATRSSVSSKDFDITLIVVLLRSICGLSPPANGWDNLPPEADITPEADIVRIKFYRVTLVGHASETAVDDETFKQYWKDIQDVIVRLGGPRYQAAIDALRNEVELNQSNANPQSKTEIEDSIVSVGKISYSKEDVLGRGSDGTVVYKGKFEDRDVAVKRILSEFFEIADKEVKLLRESDAHLNVIRYFCTEKDKFFCYIALELCEGTLQEYVENKEFECHNPAPETLLNQVMSGLSHLHSLNIVHRDIKPHNVLISKRAGKVQARISDFGLCRKLPYGHNSITHHTGPVGTDDWIAPELFTPGCKLKCSVDIFSSGCVFHFVLSGGGHPFGDQGMRQINIKSGKFDVEKIIHSELKTEAKDLIRRMISPCPSERPSAEEILKHPFFWDGEKQLAFFQDVSDRIEIDSDKSEPLVLLQKDCIPVVGEDWRGYLGEEIQQELTRCCHRQYKGSLIKDLLRVIRNKKHHYNELPDHVKKAFGPVPDGYMRYFSSRFPRLLMHTYNAMASCKNEPVFQTYYFQG